MGDVEGGGGDGLDGAVGGEDGRVVDVEVVELAGAVGELAFDEAALYGFFGDNLFEDLLGSGGRDLGDGTAKDLRDGKAYDLGESVVEAEVAEIGGIEEAEADGSGLVDGL